jgi:phosphoglycerate kinase
MSTPLAAPAFEGTALVLQRLAQSSGFSVLFGDESVRAAEEAGAIVPDGIGHISLGGEATLAFLAGKRMPGIEALRGASNE